VQLRAVGRAAVPQRHRQPTLVLKTRATAMIAASLTAVVIATSLMLTGYAMGRTRPVIRVTCECAP